MTVYKRYQSKKMQAKLLVMLMTICGLILCMISYLAVMTINQQRAMVKIQSDALVQSRIETIQNVIFDILLQKEHALKLRLKTQSLKPEALNAWMETDPNINQIFVMRLKADAKLDDTPVTQHQIEFPIVHSDNNQIDPNNLIGVISPIIQDPSLLFQHNLKEGEISPTSGWYVSQYEGQPILMYWMINTTDSKYHQSDNGFAEGTDFNGDKNSGYTLSGTKVLIGIKLSYVKLLSDVLARIEANYAPDNLEIVQSGRMLFQSQTSLVNDNNTLESTSESELFTKVLPYPLHDWQINYKKTLSTTPSLYGVTLVIVSGICLVILLLTIVVYRDLTKQHKAASMRVNFVGQVSHELKTPLTNISLYAQMQKEQLEEFDSVAVSNEYTLPPSLHQYNEVILQESQRLSRLIQNVLDFTKPSKVVLNSVLAIDIVRTLSDLFLPLLHAKGLKLNVICQDDIQLTTDADKVVQILCNLLSNVEKYASTGQAVDVIVSQTEERVIFEVRDYGPGVDDSYLPRLFEPFYRINSKLTEGVSGTGIGLTIAKQLAQSLSGKLIASPRTPGLAVSLIIPKV
ncbi:sensor histidine kinase [Thorsellia anophelis]|uniref:histidine kinase n=1 Tax=Thorsellia anophelis DSM 18579 TaxID=1123402 RepID=A0A1H9Z6R4_9GAMM|nr:HAMP domain-containing sensor histidine kinase [Thorsellia anophelis]SES77264.1 His Kinase A (phospho-acceptor) domain-containing protein [Thorsellia anophelis DSM 18579]